jgi:hypothetical protein
MPLLRKLYEVPTPIDTGWGHHRIFAQQAYRTVREAQFVPIIMAEAQDLARWFPVCWVSQGSDHPILVVFRTLLADGGGLPADAELQGEGLPLMLQAFPLVVPDAESIAQKQIFADRTIPDRPTDIGAPLLTDDGKFSRPARARAKIAINVANGLPATIAFSTALHEHGFLKTWKVDLDLGHGQRASFTDLLILDVDRLDDPLLHRLIVESGIEAALLVAGHRLSLFRMSPLLAAARRDVQRKLEPTPDPTAAVQLP